MAAMQTNHDLQSFCLFKLLFMPPLVIMLTITRACVFQKDDAFKAVPTPLSPPSDPATPVTPTTPATPATPATSDSPGTPSTPNSISPTGIVKRKTGQHLNRFLLTLS